MLYPKQLEIFKQIKDKSLLNLGTGTGKTIISLCYFLKFHRKKKLYIIAPAAKVHEKGWDREIKFICNKLKFDIPEYEVISYSSLSKHNFDKGFYILDEAHYIKNPTAKRSKSLIKILKGNEFILLSATPGSKIEEFSTYFILWNKAKNKTQFYKKYTIQQRTRIGFNSFFSVVGYNNQEEFNEILKNYSTDRLTVNDIVEMPEMIFQEKQFERNKDYTKIKRDRIYEKNGIVELLDSQIKLCTKLRQIVSTKQKIEYLKYLKERLEDDNLLIFYNFNSELEMIKEYIKPDYIINGAIKDYPKKNEFEKQKGKITLVQISAGGTGIELQYNNQVVYYSPTYSYQEYEQSLGRAYRPGQKNKVIVYKFNTLDTIESDVWHALEAKQDFNENLWDK